ncbi:MAG: hypothetical protein Q7V12_08710, partial [Deltaproteobacteria bacterium]|nr:hypothetical protein [Deltaproteobacteria bacterium]
LNGLTEEGHVYYPETDLVRKAKEILKVDQEIITKAITELSKGKEIILEHRFSQSAYGITFFSEPAGQIALKWGLYGLTGKHYVI